MTDVYTTVGGTGHRHLNPGQRDWSRREALRIAAKLRDDHGTTTVVSGLALGWDTDWAQAGLAAGLKLWAHVPFETQADRWPAADRKVWQALREAAWKTTVYGPDPASRGAAVRLLHARNHGMVDVSDAMTCLWVPQKRSGGTWGAVQLIVRRGLPAIHLDPARRTVRRGLPADVRGSS